MIQVVLLWGILSTVTSTYVIDLSGHSNSMSTIDNDCQCGVENRPSGFSKIKYSLLSISIIRRIINGDQVPHQKYPWMAFLDIYNKTSGGHVGHCTGSIINDRFILTAGHCADSDFDVRPYISSSTGTTCASKLRQTRPLQVKKIIRHPEYFHNKTKTRNDITLIQLSNPLTFTKSFTPICLSFGDTFNNWFSAGWGKINVKSDQNTSEHLSNTDCLREGKFKLFDREECHKFLSDMWEPKKVICAGYTTRTCYGDSGGPLMTRRSDGKVYQAGITSWGKAKDCGVTTGKPEPNIFEALFHHKNWISEVTGRAGAQWCRP